MASSIARLRLSTMSQALPTSTPNPERNSMESMVPFVLSRKSQAASIRNGAMICNFGVITVTARLVIVLHISEGENRKQ